MIMNEELFNQLKGELERMTTDFTLLTRLRELVRFGEGRREEIRRQEADRVRLEKIRALKALKPQSKVYTRIIGYHRETMIKIKDGKTYMRVAVHGKQMLFAYNSLELAPLNETEKDFGDILGKVGWNP